MRIQLEDFVNRVIKGKYNVFGIHVRQNGESVGSFYWNDCCERRPNINSCTKSITSIAVGIAIGEGLMRLDEKIADIFSDFLPKNPHQWLMELTIRDMLKMATGHDSCLLPRVGRDSMEETDWVRHLLCQPLAYKPGTHFQYNNMGPYLCSVIIEKRSGKTLHNWLKPRLFSPLRIGNPQWFQCPRGHTLGMGGLFLNPEELARVGQLCLDEGKWEGKQILPADYIREATSKLIESDLSESHTPDFQSGYGYHFWRNARSDSYRGWGNNGQNMIVLPHQNAVIAVMSADSGTQGILDAIWDTVVSQL